MKESNCEVENFNPLPIVEPFLDNVNSLKLDGNVKGLKLPENLIELPFPKFCDNKIVEINSKYPEQPIAIAIPMLSPAKSHERDLDYLTGVDTISKSLKNSSIENVYEKLLLMPSPVWNGSSSSIESTNTGNSSGKSSSNRSPTRAKKRQAPPPPIEIPQKHSSSSLPETLNPLQHRQ